MSRTAQGNPRGLCGGSLAAGFWFVMSMALVAGFILAYPMNWWLVANGLKHGMITVRPAGQRGMTPMGGGLSHGRPESSSGAHAAAAGASGAAKAAMTVLSTAGLVAGIALANWSSR